MCVLQSKIRKISTSQSKFYQTDIRGNETCTSKTNLVFTWRTTIHMGASRGRADDSQWESTIYSGGKVLLWFVGLTKTLQNNNVDWSGSAILAY